MEKLQQVFNATSEAIEESEGSSEIIQDATSEAIVKILELLPVSSVRRQLGRCPERDDHAGQAQDDEDDWHPYADKNPRVALRTAIEKRPQSLRAIPQKDSAKWEYVEAILDSGATVTVFPPNIGALYELIQGEAAKAGVTYEVANGEEIPNLGERLLAVMTAEGTTRGLRAQVADVSKPLQAVRQLTRTGHLVVFGDGPEGDDHYVLNRFTGERNEIKDDGINYLMGLYIMPPEEAGFGRPVAR